MTSRVKAAAQNRRTSSRKASSRNLLGGAAVACLVLGSCYAVYSNILAASVYPTLGESSDDQPVIKSRSEVVASRSTAQAIRDVFAALPAEPAPVIGRPATKVAVIPSAMLFSDRFAASAAGGVPSRAAEAAPPPVAPKPVQVAKAADAPKFAEAPKRKEPAPQQVALNLPPAAPLADEAKPAKLPAATSFREMAQRAKAAMMSITGDRKSMSEKLWGKQPSLLSYASADATASIAPDQNPALGGSAPYDRSTAVYDISAKMVYLPDGTTLEAHSGLGAKLDDPDSARVRMLGVTPPHVYELKPREALFHGVPALRLTPIGGEEAIYGRSGLLAHTYMLGPNGDSNGCVSFRDYYAFLDAYKNKGIKKLAVVTRIE
jgi:Protein of unknown function (DUF2778)